MANKYLAQEAAPFGADVWAMLNAAMIEAAKSRLVGRRLLPVEGPFGLGLKAVPLQDGELEPGLSISPLLPVVAIREEFTLGARDLAAFEQSGVPLDAGPVVAAAMACARREDELIFHGVPGVPGLLHGEGASTLSLGAWAEVGEAAEDLMRAVNLLDRAGFPGPYALALGPERYNRLFRLYPQGQLSELAHLAMMASEGIFKSPVLGDGGVLLAAAGSAALVLGQDMSLGFIGPTGNGQLQLAVSETLTLRLLRPQAVCVLRG